VDRLVGTAAAASPARLAAFGRPLTPNRDRTHRERGATTAARHRNRRVRTGRHDAGPDPADDFIPGL